jgi:Flp pilus assembly protein TadG
MSNILSRLHQCRNRSGQATVEFALAFILVAMGTFGVIDVSHAVYEEHGLNHAAEVIAHDLSVTTSGALNASTAQTDIGDAQNKSQISFDTSAPTLTVSNGVLNGHECTTNESTSTVASACQKLSNGDVAIIGIPSLCNGVDDPTLLNCAGGTEPNYTDQVEVTLTIKNFGPHTTYFNSFPVNTVTASATSETNAYLAGTNPD